MLEEETSNLKVTFVVCIVDTGYEGIIIHDDGEFAADLLHSKYASDIGLIIPEDLYDGVYECSNLRVTNQYISSNPENPEIDYDLECDWKPLWDLNTYCKI